MLRALSATVVIVCLLLAVPAQATIQPGATQWNPEVPGQPAYFVSGLPDWHTGSPAAWRENAIFPPPTGTPFIGHVRSEVYPISTGGLAFAYRFTLDPSYFGDSLKSAIFFPDHWSLLNVTRMGADGSGSSHEVSWSDGDPYTLTIDSAAESPWIRWRIGGAGTEIGAGQYSSIIWFETDAEFWVDTGTVTLLDSDIGGGAEILIPIPEPSTALLLLMGVSVAALRRRRELLGRFNR